MGRIAELTDSRAAAPSDYRLSRQFEVKRSRRSPLLLSTPGIVLADVTALLVVGIVVFTLARRGVFPESSAYAYPAMTLLIMLVLARGHLFRVGFQVSVLDDLPTILLAAVLAVFAVHFGAEFLGWAFPSRPSLALGAAAAGGLVVERTAVHWRQRRLRLEGVGQKATLIVGAGHVGSRVARRLLKHPEFGLRPIGFVDKQPLADFEERVHLPVLGSSYDLEGMIEEFNIDVVLVAFSTAPHHVMLDIVRMCQAKNVEVLVVPRLFETVCTAVEFDRLLGIPIIGMRPVSFRGVSWRVKRAFDLIVATSALILLSPLLLVIAAAIRLESKGPVLFGQERVGRDGTFLKMYKFRTMIVDAEALLSQVAGLNEAEGHLFKIRKDPRITRVGRHLRRWSLDELPQLLNVLTGDMSLVGPRPSLPREVEEYGREDLRRLKGKPGLTGLSQISGRSDLTFEEMVELDRYYLENWSLGLDLRIGWRTLFVVLGRKGAY